MATDVFPAHSSSANALLTSTIEARNMDPLVLKTRVAQLRERLRAKRGEEDDTTVRDASNTEKQPESQVFQECINSEESNAVEQFLAKDSRRRTLRSLAEDFAKRRELAKEAQVEEVSAGATMEPAWKVRLREAGGLHTMSPQALLYSDSHSCEETAEPENHHGARRTGNWHGEGVLRSQNLESGSRSRSRSRTLTDFMFRSREMFHKLTTFECGSTPQKAVVEPDLDQQQQRGLAAKLKDDNGLDGFEESSGRQPAGSSPRVKTRKNNRRHKKKKTSKKEKKEDKSCNDDGLGFDEEVHIDHDSDAVVGQKEKEKSEKEGAVKSEKLLKKERTLEHRRLSNQSSGSRALHDVSGSSVPPRNTLENKQRTEGCRKRESRKARARSVQKVETREGFGMQRVKGLKRKRHKSGDRSRSREPRSSKRVRRRGGENIESRRRSSRERHRVPSFHRSRSRGSRRRNTWSSSSLERSTCRKADKAADDLERYPPFSRVRLRNLVKNVELNGLCGMVLPAGCSSLTSVEAAGTLKVKLENGREVAAKPSNVELVDGSELKGLSNTYVRSQKALHE